MRETSEQPQLTVVIPAHNEGAVMARCLDALTHGKDADHIQLIVVCNGCTDDTAAIASQYAGVTVVDIPTASKIAALNEGDLHVQHYPVAYVDADILVSPSDLIGAATKLTPPVCVTAPRVDIRLSGCSLWVKAFYAVWLKLPYFADRHMVGSGIFILSEQGRSRFDRFPNIISDDGYVRGLFDNRERLTDTDGQFSIFAPKNLKSLIKIKTRARLGNMQVVQKYPTMKVGGENTSSAFIKLMLSRPWLIPAGVLYVLIQNATKRRATAQLNAQQVDTWERDHSSRV